DCEVPHHAVGALFNARRIPAQETGAAMPAARSEAEALAESGGTERAGEGGDQRHQRDGKDSAAAAARLRGGKPRGLRLSHQVSPWIGWVVGSITAIVGEACFAGFSVM